MTKFENIFVYLQLIILIEYKALLVIFEPYKGISPIHPIDDDYVGLLSKATTTRYPFTSQWVMWHSSTERLKVRLSLA